MAEAGHQQPVKESDEEFDPYYCNGASNCPISLAGASAVNDDRSEMDQWVKDTANQGAEPAGAKITMANWQQYKQFMPLGMQKLFEGEYYWKMPSDVEMDVGPAVYNTFLPKTWVEATEKYGPQTQVEVLPNGHYVLKNYHGGTPFPDPQEPNKGWKILANVFWAFHAVSLREQPE